MEELIQSHVKEFKRKQKGDKKMKHRKRDQGSGVSSKSNKSRAMRGRIPKIPNFLAVRNQQQEESTASHSEQHRLQLQLPLSNHKDRRAEIVASPPIMASKIHHPIRRSQHLPNVHAERVTLRIIRPHLSQLSKLCSILQISSRPKSISPPE